MFLSIMNVSSQYSVYPVAKYERNHPKKDINILVIVIKSCTKKKEQNSWTFVKQIEETKLYKTRN